MFEIVQAGSIAVTKAAMVGEGWARGTVSTCGKSHDKIPDPAN